MKAVIHYDMKTQSNKTMHICKSIQQNKKKQQNKTPTQLNIATVDGLFYRNKISFNFVIFRFIGILVTRGYIKLQL